MGHVAAKCMSERVHLVNEEDQPLEEFQVELLRILKKPVTFAKPVVHQDPYDILEDLWSTPTHVTYGQLFQDPEYKAQIMKIFEEEIEPVQALTPKQQRSTQPLKAYIRIAGMSLPTLIDTGASVCVISEDLAKKLRLRIEPNNRTKVAPLGGGSKVKVISLIPNAPIAVQNFRTPGPLYVIGGTESVVILGTDWMDYYQADIRRSDNVMEVRVNDEKACIGLQYQRNHTGEYDYMFMINEEEETWVDTEEELSQPSIRSVWRMPLSRG